MEMGTNSEVQDYGKELGKGIKESLQGLNTNASPKSKKITIKLVAIPLVVFVLSQIIGLAIKSDTILILMPIAGLCMGLHQFYVGKFKAGIIYTITMGVFGIGALISLFQLTVTHTFKDSNGFPLIY